MTTFTAGTEYVTGVFGTNAIFKVVSRTPKTIKVQGEWDNQVQVHMLTSPLPSIKKDM